MSYTVVMPVMAKEFLGGGARTLGFLMGAAGLGALGGGIYLASRETARGLEKIISKATVIFGLGVTAFSFSRLIWLSLLLMLCVGFGMIIQMVSSNTLLQHLTDDNKRGRVMGFFTAAFMGMMPLGSLLAGALASKIGSPNTLLISGLSCILGSLFFVSRLSLKHR
jgi:MFS family permease